MADMMTRCKCGHTRRQHFEADETCGVVGCECCEFAPVPAAPAPEPEITTDALERWTQRQYENALRRRTDREMDNPAAPEATREADDETTEILEGVIAYMSANQHFAAFKFYEPHLRRIVAERAAQAREIETLRADKARMRGLALDAVAVIRGVLTRGDLWGVSRADAKRVCDDIDAAALAARAPEPAP